MAAQALKQMQVVELELFLHHPHTFVFTDWLISSISEMCPIFIVIEKNVSLTIAQDWQCIFIDKVL